eukprot:g14819.t1
MLTAGTVRASGMGLVCGGLHALGPDHLATLVTFSALMKPTEAAKVGASWGVGHCFGVVMIGVCMYVLGSLLQLHMEGLEHTADRAHIEREITQLRQSFAITRDAATRTEHTHCAHETTPLIVHDAVQDRGGKSAAVGFLQGMCCPMGLVQVSYLAGQSAFDTAVFVFVCVAVVIMGTALVSALWAALTRSSMGQTVTPRIMYRASCFLAFACGVLWITANFFHILHKVNYAEHEAIFVIADLQAMMGEMQLLMLAGDEPQVGSSRWRVVTSLSPPPS